MSEKSFIIISDDSEDLAVVDRPTSIQNKLAKLHIYATTENKKKVEEIFKESW
jgi:hypothetical protein